MPASVKESLSRLIAQFIWNASDKKSIHWVSWKTVCLPKSCGGLGITDVHIRNRALLNKWLWRFGTEQESLWRKVMAAKYGENDRSFLPTNLNTTNKSWIWKSILSPLCASDDKFCQNLKLLIGDGNNILFWSDKWVGDKTLKDAFPRLFSLALNKSGVIAVFGNLVDVKWQWNIPLRRNLFEWEKGSWVELMALINNVAFGNFSKDGLRWNDNSNGEYSAKSYINLILPKSSPSSNIWNFSWPNLAPPKVEAFLWKALHGRIPTKVELAKRGVRFNDGLRCPLCLEVDETVSHLFCQCKVSLRIWLKWLKEWGLSMVFPEKIQSFYLSRIHM